ncbi:cd109 antigen [Lasius niger]|uniref:TEP1-F n=1 Tax=Lasius niger TaxID=67767 RepID=A0A0J7L4N1_LASNI|nr:cd109 antigen [Lasius niger]
MEYAWLGILVLSGIISNVAAESFYTIIAPKVVRPDSEYHVAASVTGVSTPSTIYVELTGELDAGRVFNISRTVVVEPYSTKILRLDIGETTPGRYKLTARGLSGIDFYKSTDIEYVHKSYSVFIQTDRAIYKPGHKVMFRCIILDSRLRPSIVGPTDVYIIDGDGNRIKQWTRPSVAHGIFSSELELSHSPVLGNWKIIANVGDQTFEKEFEVAEYVLPNFEVTIDSPKHVQFKESKVMATVNARYTYGKPVKGEATITAYPDIFSGVIQPIFQQPVRKVVPIDGKVTVDFDILSELRLTDEYERPIMIDVVVEEALTTRRQNASIQVTLHKHKYTMELIKTSEYFKPGLKYTAFLKLTNHDGSPVQDTKNDVLIAYGYTYDRSAYLNVTRMLDQNGMVQLDLYPPKANDNISFPLNIEVNNYIEIEVNSTAPLKYISYEVLGRGDILDAGSIYVQDKSTTTFKFLATYVMAPTAHVIVYYVRTDGEVIADSLDVELTGILQNFIDLKVTPGEVMPGESVNLVISAKPNSFIGLLGIDQRSILLKSGNDISYLKVFRPFFISMDLPYSVIRGEIVGIQIVVFNYMNKDLTAEVLLNNEGQQFDFAEVSNEVHDVPKLELYRRKKVDVKANSGSSVSFMIIPKELGYIFIKATANSVLAGDSVEHKLLVNAEGETQYKNEAVFLDLRNVENAGANVTINIPNNAVPGSESIHISAVGDILGPSIPNLANLIKMPFGCGEQNMLNFVPNIVVLNYLKNTNQLTQAVQSKALKYLDTGYQQELTYRHTDGSFSAFGMSDPSGSTWLTAFVVKSFKQAADYIPVEDRIINEALEWLSNNQAANGSFPEVGKVSHRDMQGGAAKGLALTAYTLVAFLENEDSVEKYRNTINKAVDYIVRNIEGLNDTYALSLCAYALNLAKHPYETSAFNFLESMAMTKQDVKWWSKPIPKDDKNPHYSLPRSVDVEMTSYALLSYLRRNLVADAIPVMKWLVKQRNTEGGFASTQDTVIGLQALAKLAEKLSKDTSSVRIAFKYGKEGQGYMNINSGNSMILQKQILPTKTRSVNITASGKGFVLVQVSYQYNLNVTGAWPLFTLDPQVDKNSNVNHLQLSICSGFVPTKEANESNMAVMEVSLPSGFTVDRDSLPSLELSSHVKRVETKNGDTMVVLYFDKMIKEEYCPTVSAFRTHKVAKQKPVPVSIYDYYDSSRRARVFYEARRTTLCDLCEDEDCEDICVSKPGKQKDNATVSAASHIYTCVYLQLTFFSFYLLLHKYL